MKILKFYGTKTQQGVFSLQGIKSLYKNDTISRNDIQTTMAVIQWLNTMDIIIDYLSWLWDDGTELQWDDGTPCNY